MPTFKSRRSGVDLRTLFVSSGPRRRRVAVSFTEEIYTKVKKRAEDKGIPFSSMALQLISCGLLDYEESELFDEPQKETAK